MAVCPPAGCRDPPVGAPHPHTQAKLAVRPPARPRAGCRAPTSRGRTTPDHAGHPTACLPPRRAPATHHAPPVANHATAGPPKPDHRPLPPATIRLRRSPALRRQRAPGTTAVHQRAALPHRGRQHRRGPARSACLPHGQHHPRVAPSRAPCASANAAAATASRHQSAAPRPSPAPPSSAMATPVHRRQQRCRTRRSAPPLGHPSRSPRPSSNSALALMLTRFPRL